MMTRLEVAWECDLHWAANERSIITPALIVVPERDTKLCRVSPSDGSTMWVANVRNSWGWIAHAGAICAYLNQHSVLQCFGIEDGIERWSVDLADYFGFVTIVSNHVVVGGWRGYTDLHALRAEDGAVTWSAPMRGRALMAPLAGPDRSLLLPLPSEGRVVVLDAATGAPRDEWRCPCPAELPDASSFLVVRGDRFVCRGSDGEIVQLGRDTGDAWDVLVQHKRPISSFAPALTDSLIVFEDVGGNLCAYSLDALTERWEAPVLHRRRDLLPVAGLPSGALAFGAASGLLHIFGPNGDGLARVAVGKRFRAGLAHTSAGMIVGAAGGRLMAFDVRTL
jgi:outer membrane protein assembly factor BamB